MTPKAIVDALNAFQELQGVHELTCGKNSDHRPLVARLSAAGEAELYCLDCDYVQHHIPMHCVKMVKGDYE